MVIIGQFSKPEEAQEQGLVYSTRVETLQLFKKIFSDWEPWWQAAPLNFSSNIAGGAASIPGLLVALKLRFEHCKIVTIQREYLKKMTDSQYFTVKLTLLDPASEISG